MNALYKYNILALLVVALLAGCTEQLELEPAQSISENLALNSDKNIKTALVGAYDALSNGDVFGGNALRNSELLGGDDEIQWVGTFNSPREIFNKRMISSNLDAQELWLESYEAINVANNVLSALDKVNPADRDRVEGEARFIRGILYFELVRFYAKQYEDGQTNSQLGVPLVITPTRGISKENQVSRNTVEEVYAQIIEDLSQAESKLPSSNGVFANTSAAAAVLARVYLQQRNYQAARDAADRVIASGNYTLMGNYADAFNQDSNVPEYVFAIRVTSQDGVNNMNTFYSIPDFGGRDGDIDILEGHLSLYDPNDQRLALYYEGNGAIRTGKWNNQFGNIPLIRLAEMYLIRAECNQRLGTATGATPVDDYNEVHTRAGLPAATSITLDDILLERRLELAHEGFKIHDHRRLQIPVGSNDPNSDPFIFPIPQREINANPNLVQNPGY
ncbi:MAG: RagB/SusD family nutrient uptake outer membrane protein [Bacteroidetes bacterium]|nr:MAG: RagB/SusD family nutrient uptake outer membrane protein [Bacteroidota bacterium]